LSARTAAALGLLAAVAFAGCQSTQEKSAELAKQGQQAFTEKGLSVTKENPDVKVLGTTVLSDPNGSAVAVELRNTSSKALVNLPIAIDVRDKKGKTVFQNNLPGLDPALTSIALLKPGETATWVNDQVFAASKPASVKVKVGIGERGGAPEKLPSIEVSAPKLTDDPVSGVEANGVVHNHSKLLQRKFTLFTVARKGNKIIAAGRGEIDKLKPIAGKNFNYHVFFIGDPKGGSLQLFSPPTALK